MGRGKCTAISQLKVGSKVRGNGAQNYSLVCKGVGKNEWQTSAEKQNRAEL